MTNSQQRHCGDKRQIEVLITDLDNTLFDWFRFWYRSFTAMLDELVRTSGIPVERLEREIKTVHEKHGTSEYAFVIEELPSLREKHHDEDLAKIYESAIAAFRDARRTELALYPTVRETLQAIKNKGCLIIGYTESLEFYSKYRVLRLGLDGLLDLLYFPPDHELPGGLTREQIRHYAPEAYQLRFTQARQTPKGEIKPNPKLLLRILDDVGASADRAAYVGDSLMKDVAMAQAAGVEDVWAEYGTSHQKAEYELLRRVTHWTSEAVEKEKALSNRDVSPTHVLKQSLAELLQLFAFAPFRSRNMQAATGVGPG